MEVKECGNAGNGINRLFDTDAMNPRRSKAHPVIPHKKSEAEKS
jgi:hypothetical protein